MHMSTHIRSSPCVADRTACPDMIRPCRGAAVRGSASQSQRVCLYICHSASAAAATPQPSRQRRHKAVAALKNARVRPEPNARWRHVLSEIASNRHWEVDADHHTRGARDGPFVEGIVEELGGGRVDAGRQVELTPPDCRVVVGKVVGVEHDGSTRGEQGSSISDRAVATITAVQT